MSLANKCLVLFGAALVVTVVAALWVPWLRMNALVDDGQRELSRQLVDAWERLDAGPGRASSAPSGEPVEHAGIQATRLTLEQAQAAAAGEPFIARVLKHFQDDPNHEDLQVARWTGIAREYRYARAIRSNEPPQDLQGLIVLHRQPLKAAQLVALNTLYLGIAGIVVLGLGVLGFYLITHYIVLSPVHTLKQTAERIRQGDMAVRSEIRTGDEFEELSDTFNAMLSELLRAQDQLKAINSALDIKVDELAAANSALFETARLKGEFLANVSHELRTPLNSIVGFAELLREGAQAEADAGDDSTRLQKRIRYLENIVNSSRNLLEMINGLLEMARIEAGKATLNPGPMDLHESCQTLLSLISPLAERKGIELVLEAPKELPTIETDVKKFQQVVFNFLSNAVKFTPGSENGQKPGRITLRAEHLPSRGGGEGGENQDQVRVSVIDTGPGIAPEDQSRLFQKFEQLDRGHTKEHAGTGLGLAISKELAAVLQGEIQVESEVGRGSMFSLILPMRLDRRRLAETTPDGAGRAGESGAAQPETAST